MTPPPTFNNNSTPTSGAPVPPNGNGKKNDGNGKYILWIVLGCLIIAGLVALVLLFSSRDKSTERGEDSTDIVSEKTLGSEETPVADSEIQMVDVVTLPSGFSPGNYVIKGWVGESPVSYDVKIDSKGNISGSYINILYDIHLSASGKLDAAGNLSMTLGSGVETSHLTASRDSQKQMLFNGSWGKNNTPVSLVFSRGSQSAPMPNHSGVPVTIRGGGMVKHAVIFSSGNSYYLYYPDQPIENKMQLVINGDDVCYVYDPEGGYVIAEFDVGDGYILDSRTVILYVGESVEFEMTIGS